MDGAAPPHSLLRRQMSGLDGLLLTLAGLSPSIGVFVVGSDVLLMVGSGAVICFLAAVVLGIAMASIYAELGSAIPSAGGEYTIAGRLLGADAGFAMLSINMFGLCLAMALSSLGVTDYLQAAVPHLPTMPTALGVIVVVTGLAVLSIRSNALVTGVLLGCEMASLAAVAWLGFTHVQPGTVGRLWHPMVAAPTGGLHAVSLAMLGVGAAGGIYAFNGYGSVIFFGEELRDPRRSVAAIVYGSLAIAAVTELLPMAAVVMGSPDLVQLTGAQAPIAQFVGRTGGRVFARVMSMAVAAAIFNAMIAIMLTAGRQLYATARDNAWGPSGSRLASLHPRFGSPHVATMVMGAAALVCCFLPAGLVVTILANGNVATYATLSVAAIAGAEVGSHRAARHGRPSFRSARYSSF